MTWRLKLVEWTVSRTINPYIWVSTTLRITYSSYSVHLSNYQYHRPPFSHVPLSLDTPKNLRRDCHRKIMSRLASLKLGVNCHWAAHPYTYQCNLHNRPVSSSRLGRRHLWSPTNCIALEWSSASCAWHWLLKWALGWHRLQWDCHDAVVAKHAQLYYFAWLGYLPIASQWRGPPNCLKAAYKITKKNADESKYIINPNPS